MRNLLRRTKRPAVDALGNYVFFCPIVLAFNAWGWSTEAVVAYLVTSIPIAAFGRPYTFFLKKVWYPLFKEEF